MSQRKYTLSLLEDTGLLECKPAKLPMNSNIKLTNSEGDLLADPSQYHRMIGRLMYLTISRPDICFPVHKLSQYMQAPRKPHLQVVHHLLQYLKSAPGQGLFFPANNSMNLTAYADADWSSCLDTRRSTTGFAAFLGDVPLSWKSKK